jgi:hypothetical protein
VGELGTGRDQEFKFQSIETLWAKKLAVIPFAENMTCLGETFKDILFNLFLMLTDSGA